MDRSRRGKGEMGNLGSEAVILVSGFFKLTENGAKLISQGIDTCDLGVIREQAGSFTQTLRDLNRCRETDACPMK